MEDVLNNTIMKTLKKKTIKFTAKIKSIKKEILVETNENFLNVELEICEGKKVVEIRKLAFPFGKSSKEIKSAVEKYVETFNADAELAEASKEREKINSQVDKVIEDLEGLTV